MIVQRYLFREVLLSVSAVLTVLLIIYSSNRFVRFLTEAALGRTSTDLLFQMLGLKLAANLSLLVPVALFLGAIFALGRLHRDSEVVAMTAGGVGPRYLVVSMLLFSTGFAVVTSVLSLYVSPLVLTQYETVRERALRGYQITGILPGRFKVFDGGEKVVYAGAIGDDKRTLEDVFVHVRTPGQRQQLLLSDRAYQTVIGREGDRFIVLEDGHRYAGTPGDADYVVTEFRKHAVRLGQVSVRRDTGRLDAMRTVELWRIGGARHWSELQWRISLPLSVMVLGLMAVPLGSTAPRGSRYAKLFVAVLVYFLYNNALGIAQKLVERGELPPLIGVWPVHLLAAGLALAMVFMQGTGGRRVVARLRRMRARR